MGAIVHPYFHSKPRMVSLGLCTENKYEAVQSDLLDRMARYFEGKD